MVNLGNKIRELRKNRGITQEQLANALGCSPQAVSKWEMSAGYPDVATLPVIAAYFGVSLDDLFDYDPKKIEDEIRNILYKSRGEAHSFEMKIKVLKDGIAAYPNAHILKRELLEHYASHLTHKGIDFTEEALDIAKQIVAECQDSFITLGAMGDMAYIYIKSGQYEKGKEIIESMPYRYHLDIYDRMRCTVMFLKSRDSIEEARQWKRLAHQDLYLVCKSEAKSFFKLGDYENALLSYEEAVDLLDRFWRRDVPREYALLQDPFVSKGFTMVCIAACYYRLNRIDECDTTLDRAYHLIRNCYSDEEWEEMKERRMFEFRNWYDRMGLNEYKPCAY